MYNQQTGLPYPVDKLLVAFINVNLNNPPYVPRDYNGPSWMYTILPIVSAAAIIEIQQRANTPLRVFMLNQMSVNNYANQDFDSLVKNIMDYIMLGIVNKYYQTPDAGISDAVSVVCELQSAANVEIYRQLSSFIDQNTMNAVMAAINEFHNVGMQITNMKTQMRATQYPQQGFPQQQVFPQQQRNIQQNSSLFSGHTSDQSMFPLTQSKSAGKYSSDILQQKKSSDIQQKSSDIQQPFTRREEMVEAISPPIGVLVKDSGVVWKPRLNKHYYLCTNPETQNLYYSLSNGDFILDIFNKPRDVPLMDEERHRLTTVFGNVPNTFIYDKEVKGKITNDVIKLNSVLDDLVTETKDENDIDVTTYINSKVAIRSSLADAWTNLNVHRLQMCIFDDAVISKVYRGYYIVATTIVSKTNDKPTLSKYGECKTFSSLVDLLNLTLNDVSIEFWTQCNSRMTALVNRLLKEELAIPKLSIDSFVEDVESLILHLDDNYGSVIKDSFLRYQECYIQVTMLNIHDQYTYFDPECTIEGDNVPCCTYLAIEYNLTYVDITSFDLGIDLANEVAAKLEYGTNQFLYILIETILKDNERRDNKFIRNLIKTKDGRILSCCKGLIGDDCYLLTLVE